MPKLKILIVEDSPADYVLIRQMLEGLKGYSCEICHSETLKESLKIIDDNELDLILLDLILPDSSGADTYDRVMQVAGEIPVVILSGISDAGIALNAVKLGVQDYLVKGEFDEKLLLKSVLYSLERKKNTALIRQSQETYRLLFEENPLPILICNLHNSSLIRLNQASVNSFGYTEDELKDKPWQTLLAEGEENQELRPGQVKIFRLSDKNQQIRYAECRSSELEYEGKQCLLIITDDITERRKTIEAVQFQSNILNSVSEPVVVADRNGLISYWNQAASETFGYQETMTIGKPVSILYPEIEKANLEPELREINAGKRTQWESKLITREHQLLWVDNRVSLLYGENGQVTGIIRVIKDISKERRSGGLLQETVAMLDSVFNNVIQGIVLLDEHYRIKTFNTKANKQVSYLMGMEMQAGRSFMDYLNAEMHPEFMKRVNKAVENQRESWEMAYTFSGGRIHWFDFGISTVTGPDKQVSAYCLSMVDITGRKLADDRLKLQYHEIETANRELDRIVKVLSHDLRAPMNSISGLISLAKDEKDPQEFGNYLNMMEKSVHKLENFTADIIHSLKNRDQKIIHSEINLYHLVEELYDELRFSKGAEQIQLNNHLPKDMTLNTDAVQLRVILSNLISNAIKYSDLYKPIPFIKLSVFPDSEFVEIMVEDNGIGMSDEHLPKIFDAHYTIAPSGELSKGLGLSNVKSAIEKLGGTISVQSSPGTGSTFKIRLPKH